MVAKCAIKQTFIITSSLNQEHGYDTWTETIKHCLILTFESLVRVTHVALSTDITK